MKKGRLPKQVEVWIHQQGFGELKNIQPVGGGCINNGMRLETTAGGKFFLKVNSQAPEDMFAREAEGLRVLSVPDGPRVPCTYLYGKDYILMEDLEPSRKTINYWEDFGRQMAVLHKNTSARYGFDHDNYIGSTVQPNNWTDDGYEFFAEQRLLYQAEMAFKRKFLDQKDMGDIEELVGRLPDLIPQQPASLVHGDLWTGNATSDREGNPAIIDPAAHYGWAEADLAMTTLFGSFPKVFFRAYQDIRPLGAGYHERFAVYNLYHLINHVNIFGGSYLGQVRSILRKYT